jgi:3',5'-cyclic AMP phosphodiesterase CpdA
MTENIQTFRDHFLSIYQSAVSEVARRIDEKRTSDPKIGRRAGSAVRRSASSLLPNYAAEIATREYAQRRGQVIPPPPAGQGKRVLRPTDAARVCAELAFRYFKARLSGDAEMLAKVEGEFKASTCDPAWKTTIEEYVKYFGPSGSRKQIPYIRPAAVGPKTVEIRSNALVGDWGTGAQPAIQVLKHIASWNPDILIHLGDIYYSGTAMECASNFNSLIESVLRSGNPALIAYTLAGNHDMYCGGVGYYDLIKHLNPNPFKQPASFLCLRSADEKWQLLAMDTGLHDYSPLGVDEAVTFIEDDELEWHCARLKEFPGRTVLLSHHQLFSAFSPIGKADQNGRRSALNPHLFKAFNSLAASGHIAAWFWGHEHTLSIYDPFAGLQRGRCVGHGAVPVSILDKIYVPVSGLDKTPTVVAGTQLRQQGSVYAHGYAGLTFGTDACSAEYYQDVGRRAALVYSEII